MSSSQDCLVTCSPECGTGLFQDGYAKAIGDFRCLILAAGVDDNKQFIWLSRLGTDASDALGQMFFGVTGGYIKADGFIKCHGCFLWSSFGFSPIASGMETI